MSLLQAILLGIVQGLTEFLPVSSSAHLTLAGTALGLISKEHPEQWTAFIAVVQLGTLAAVLLYFWRDILTITSAFVRENLLQRAPFAAQSLDARMGWYIILGSLPIVTLGLALKKIIEGDLTKNLTVIAIGLILFSAVLAFAERVAKLTRSMDEIHWTDALWVGIAQVFALMPGPSRSGVTLTAGLFLGLQRDVAARFSFLLSIPAVFGSGLLELRHVDFTSLTATSASPNIATNISANAFAGGVEPLALAVATLVSGVSGYAAIAFLLRYLGTHTTMIFVVYRVLLGAGILAFVR
jgi:undecaprenyl-diphosphatase